MWGVTVRLDVIRARRVCQEQGWKYLHASLWLMTLAINETAAMQYRIRNQQQQQQQQQQQDDESTTQPEDDERTTGGKEIVIRHHLVHASCPILRKDGETYGFCVFESNNTSFAKFRAYAVQALEEYHNNSEGLNKSPRDDILHGSVLPWIDFTSYEHATGSRPDIPKYVFGKLVNDEVTDRWSQSFCIHTHHALADGLHVGQFLERFQCKLDQAESLLMT
eukprot:scaffold4599_cov219-Amphora_coffeaeformis.AAC.13